MGFATRFSFWAPPDPMSARIGQAGEVFAARVRLGCGAVGSLIPLWTILEGAGDPGTWVGLGYALVMVLLGFGVLAAVRRPRPPRWLGAFTCVADVSLVTALHVAIMAGGTPPHRILASVTGFSLYFIALA